MNSTASRSRAVGTMAALLALGVFAPGTARAWTHTGFAWVPQEDFPVPYYVAGRQDCENTVVDALPDPDNYCKEFIQQGHQTWHDQAACAAVSSEYQGENPNIGFFIDYNNYVSFDDPGPDGDITTRADDDITDAGTLAVTRSNPGRQLFTFNGKVYHQNTDADIVFENDINFGTPDEMETGCNGKIDILGVGTHEIGHLYGMGHSCEEGDPCQDPILRSATMFWTTDSCTTAADDLNEDDIEGITALYGPSASFACSNQLSDDLALGVVPFDLKCSVVSDYLEEITSVEWHWGDGSDTSSGLNASHTYTEQGNFTVEVDVNGDREACGPEGWSNEFRKVGFVRACDVPAPEFTVEHVDGLEYQMLNDTDVSVYGCYSNIQWEIYKGGSVTGEPIAELSYSGWEPKITFPDEGTYTIVLNLGGPGGTGAATVTLDAKDYRGEGYSACDSTGGSGAGLAAGGLLALVLRRKTRKA